MDASLPAHKDSAKYRVAGSEAVAKVSGDGTRGYVVRDYENEADADAGFAIGEMTMNPEEFKAKTEGGELMPADEHLKQPLFPKTRKGH